MSMKLFIPLSISVTLFAGLSAATLDIYQDGAKYRTIPIDRFIGFSKGLNATCDGEYTSLISMETCPPKQRLCQEIQKIEVLSKEKMALEYESQTLKKLVSLSKPTQIEAAKWIDAAEKIGKYTSELRSKRKKVSDALHRADTLFSEQAPAKKAIGMQKKCAGELELTIPAGYIGAKLLYEADTGEKDKIRIKQYIALTNHSGIDIVAKEATVYAKSYRIYLRPQQFSPWIASIRRVYRSKKSISRKKVAYAEDSMLEASIAPVEPVSSVGAVVKTGYKNYHIAGLELPSTGEEIRVKIADYQSTVTCELVSYPYMDSHVYRACSFMPQSPIESNQWRIQKGKRLVSDQAYGEYREGKYRLNVDIDEEVLIDRKPIVKKDRSSGIFGGSIRKKDGFALDVTNISDQAKTVKIIERIPTSTTDKIKVKLIRVEGANSHMVSKDGKVEIKVILPPHVHQKIKVFFTLSYDKDTKISY